MTSKKPPKKDPDPDQGVARSRADGARLSRSPLGEALRANLKKRKDQARARAQDGAPDDEKSED